MQQYNGNSGLGIELFCRECLRQLGKDRVQLQDEINAFFGPTEGSYTWFKLHTASTFILNKIKNKKEGKPRQSQLEFPKQLASLKKAIITAYNQEIVNYP